ncbi:MAG: hypothetical protein ACOH2M_01145 [Cypionkella sp.]
MPAANFQSVNADGWSVTYASPPTFNPLGSPEAVTVTRSGYDTSGAVVAVVDDLICMSRIRLPYPNQASLSADQVALSDFIYAGETISGSPVNNSARAYPKPVSMWLNHDREVAKASTHTLRLAVAHGYARNGKPVAAVKFIVSDGTTTVEQLVSAMSLKAYTASGMSVPHYAAAMDLSTLAQGALLTVDAIIYPWVGVPFQISVDADAYPSVNLTTLRLLNDRTGAYGTAYAYVDATLGNNGTAVTSSNPATAAAAPYATIAAAATAITAYNSANFGRSTDAGGGIIRLVEGVHTHASSFKTSGASLSIPLVIEAADLSKTATTVLQDNTTGVTNGTPVMLKLKGLTLRKQGASITFIDSSSGSSGRLICEDCIWDLNGKSSYAAWVYRVGIFTQINCSGYAGQPAAFGTSYKTSIAIGCANCTADSTYHVVGCKGGGLQAKSASGSMPATAGMFLGWSTCYASSGGNRIVGIDVPQGARGCAVVGCTFESWGTHNAAVMQMAADNNTMAVENCIVMGNTIIGDRANLLYLETGNAEKSGFIKFNVFRNMNIKSDVFASNGADIGNWSARYKAGWSHNYAPQYASNGAGYSATQWLGEIPSLGEIVGGMPNYTADRSHDGDNTGLGDYAPLAGSSIPLIPAGKAPWPFDFKGQAIANDGTARIGAVQASASGITGSASGSIGLTGAGQAAVAVKASASGAVPLSGTSSAAVRVSGDGATSGAGAIALGGAAEGHVAVAGTAGGLLPLSGTASAALKVSGAAATQIAFGGNASSGTGSPVSGDASGVLALSGGAVGALGVKGIASGLVSLGGAAAGAVSIEANAAGELDLFGATIAGALSRGIANGGLTLAGMALAGVKVKGHADGAIEITGGASSVPIVDWDELLGNHLPTPFLADARPSIFWVAA